MSFFIQAVNLVFQFYLSFVFCLRIVPFASINTFTLVSPLVIFNSYAFLSFHNTLCTPSIVYPLNWLLMVVFIAAGKIVVFVSAYVLPIHVPLASYHA